MGLFCLFLFGPSPRFPATFFCRFFWAPHLFDRWHQVFSSTPKRFVFPLRPFLFVLFFFHPRTQSVQNFPCPLFSFRTLSWRLFFASTPCAPPPIFLPFLPPLFCFCLSFLATPFYRTPQSPPPLFLDFQSHPPFSFTPHFLSSKHPPDFFFFETPNPGFPFFVKDFSPLTLFFEWFESQFSPGFLFSFSPLYPQFFCPPLFPARPTTKPPPPTSNHVF